MLKLEKQIMNTECRSGGHTDHLCYLISQGFHLSNEQWFKTLIEDPKFRCNRCGRTANSKVNLCRPGHL